MFSLYVCELVYACWMKWSIILFHSLGIEWELVPSCGSTNFTPTFRF